MNRIIEFVKRFTKAGVVATALHFSPGLGGVGLVQSQNLSYVQRYVDGKIESLKPQELQLVAKVLNMTGADVLKIQRISY